MPCCLADSDSPDVMSEMMEFDTQQLNAHLQQLVAQACSCPPKSVNRRKYLQQLHYWVTTTNRLWRTTDSYYSDALQDMWEYCFHHIDDYDPDLAGVITWMNANLKRFLQRYRDRRQRNRNRHITIVQTNQGDIDRIPARPDVGPALEMRDKTLDWVQTDPKGVLRKTCFRKRAEINAQVLILKRFPDKIPWKAIAAEFNLSPSEATDLPKFYNRRCLPLLRAFGKEQGYLDS
ncbi:MAG: sigma-70 family RNA polymerase sigma factor [Cyanobacteria bacterium P01_F01_bin.150]